MGKYLYNSVELPVLPEWDKKTYPYAVMTYEANYSPSSTLYGVYLFLSTVPLEYHIGTKAVIDSSCLYSRTDGSMLIFSCGNETFNNSDCTKFEVSNAKDFGTGKAHSFTTNYYKDLLWANYDIRDYDNGGVLLPASYPIDPETGEEIHDYGLNPIPVGSAPEVEPKSLMLGWLVGQKVRSALGPRVGRKPYLTFSSSEPFTLSREKTSKSWDGALYYSTDAQTWNEWDGTTTLSSGDMNTLYMRGSGNSVITKAGAWYASSVWNLSGTGIQCLGNIETLLDYEAVGAGRHPVMANSCFAYLFSGCTSLVTAPELPATTLSKNCYEGMFYGCTSLVMAPELLATTLFKSCYEGMFYGCANLTKAPKLPAITLATSCYNSMFYGCTGLVAAPELPATTLANYCYSGMFRGCSNLSKAPELPAETLTQYCYEYMFYECTSLTQAPKLPATTLAIYCYYYMFYGCTSLTTAPELPATSLADYCYYTMFHECTSLVQAPKLPATALTESCYRSMFCGCTSLLTPPELPATSLAEFCYYEMFRRCTNLITLPRLCATTLYRKCYSRMFWDCTSIKISATATNEYQNSYRIPISGTGMTAESALENMFYNTGGTLADTPTINTTYYTSNTVV